MWEWLANLAGAELPDPIEDLRGELRSLRMRMSDMENEILGLKRRLPPELARVNGGGEL